MEASDLDEVGSCIAPGNGTLFSDQRGYVRVVDGNNTGTANCDMGAVEENSFDLCTTKPGKPVLLSPANAAAGKKRVLLLDWDSTGCGMTYKIMIRQDSKQGTVVFKQDGLSGHHLITPKLAKGHTYFWKVKACNVHGCGKGRTRSFTVS